MILGVDVWEGQLETDETILKASDVQIIVPRLNSISGGHHKDDLFDKQWTEAAGFFRGPYFVYNPWVYGTLNAEWLLKNVPSSGVTRVFADIEVKKDGYSPDTYAAEVGKFIEQVQKYYPVTIYTGMWFLSTLSYWPKNVDYWWARYPWVLYPETKTFSTWERMHTLIDSVGWNPDPKKLCPGTVMLWQCSADRFYLPGTNNRAIDINVFKGTAEELSSWWGTKAPLTLYQRVAILEREARARGWNLEP